MLAYSAKKHTNKQQKIWHISGHPASTEMNISFGHLQGVIFAPSMLVVDVGSKVVVVVTLFYHQILPHTVLLAKWATIYRHNGLWIHFVHTNHLWRPTGASSYWSFSSGEDKIWLMNSIVEIVAYDPWKYSSVASCSHKFTIIANIFIKYILKKNIMCLVETGSSFFGVPG